MYCLLKNKSIQLSVQWQLVNYYATHTNRETHTHTHIQFLPCPMAVSEHWITMLHTQTEKHTHTHTHTYNSYPNENVAEGCCDWTHKLNRQVSKLEKKKKDRKKQLSRLSSLFQHTYRKLQHTHETPPSLHRPTKLNDDNEIMNYSSYVLQKWIWKVSTSHT